MIRIAVYIVSLVLAVICGWLARSPSVIYETEVVRDTVATIDTVEVYGLIEIKETVVVTDTLFIDSGGDTISTEVAELDTIFIDGARLSVAYFISPRIYDIKYKPAPVQIRTVEITNTVTAPRRWWDKPGAILAVGIIGGALVAK